jgi:hypothetical protein
VSACSTIKHEPSNIARYRYIHHHNWRNWQQAISNRTAISGETWQNPCHNLKILQLPDCRQNSLANWQMFESN